MAKIFTLSFVLCALSLAATPPREITIHTEKKEDGIHWSPDPIEVTQGETVTIVAKHEVPGGFDFHGLFIPELKISEKIDRTTPESKPTTVTRTIPKDMKPGKYKIGCQFHEKHVAATLVVKAAEPNKAK